MIINHNRPALIAQNILSSRQTAAANSIGKLSSGLRINSAADDAAGLAISEKMRAQIGGLEQAERNAQDGVSMIQTAEGALQEVHSIIQRMRELSVQAANDTLTQQDRSYIQEEIDQLRDEIDRIGNTTQFNRKKLLDGSAAVLWSSSDLTTKAVVNGSLRSIDQFGQKSVKEGNYKLSIEADPGQSEVLKTNSLVVPPEERKVKDIKIPLHDTDVPIDHPEVPGERGDITYDDFSIGVTYTEDTPDRFPMGVNGVLNFDVGLPYDVIIGGLEIILTLDDDYYFSNNLRATDPPLLKMVSVDGWFTRDDGTSGRIDGITFDEQLFPTLEGEPPRWTDLTLTSGGQEVAKMDFTTYTKDYDVYWGPVRYIWDDDSAETGLDWPWPYSGPRSNYWQRDDATEVDISLMVGSTPYNLNADDVAGKLIQLNDVAGGEDYKLFNVLDFRNMTADQIRGIVPLETSPTVTIGGKQGHKGPYDYIHYQSLEDLSIFRDAQGRSMLADPQTITITQGDGKQASFTLYADDTISSILEKLNSAIGIGLGQALYTDVTDKFAQFASEPVPQNGALTAVDTIVVSSALPGQDGRLYFSGDEDLMKVLGMNTIREAEESRFDILVEDAHSGEVITRTSVTGSRMIGELHDNIDVIFDPMSDTEAVYNANTGYFDLRKTDGGETFLHIADNTTVFQIGANEGEDMGINIGDMRVESLGLNRVIVSDRGAAARSITVIDAAMDKISKQRASLGAYQNRLEHTASNLVGTAENLTASESRIRDLDMAKEMMNFTKLSILVQSATSMLGQANQLPQNILSLLR